MKKSNTILGAIGVLSILGGVLAFKAQHRFGAQLFCYTTVGLFVGSSLAKVYTPVRGVAYTTTAGIKTLFCTIPHLNATYQVIKVIPEL